MAVKMAEKKVATTAELMVYMLVDSKVEMMAD